MSEKVDKDIVGRLIEEYKNSRHMADKVQARVDEFKRELTRLVKAHGTPDDRGHLWLPGLDNQVNTSAALVNPLISKQPKNGLKSLVSGMKLK